MSPQQVACLVWVVAWLCGAAVPASAVLIGHVIHAHGGAHDGPNGNQATALAHAEPAAVSPMPPDCP
jgi:hypothetical protein